MEPKRPTDPDYLGGWKVTSRLGEGGFGTVFLATKGVQSAAIKVIKEEFLEDSTARARIINEARVLSRIDDVYIGKIIDAGLEDEIPWLATEYVNGPTLEEKVQLDKPLGELAWFNLASDLFHALVTSHAAGVTHKDVKPSNIILGETGTKLVDFGISHVSGMTKTATVHEFEGSHPFSAPENYTGKSVPEMDVFSAATTLAYAGTGHAVWSGENAIQIMRSINEGEPNLQGLTQLQLNFLSPLFEKNASERSTAAEALGRAVQAIEFLVTKNPQFELSRTSKPNYKITLVQKRILATGLLSLLGVSGAYAIVQSQTSNGPSKVLTIPSPTPSPSNSLPSPVISSTPKVLVTQTVEISPKATPSASPKATPSASPSRSVTLQPSQSNKIKISSPDALDVTTSYVYGAPWLTNDLMWEIEVSNISESVPVDFNQLQVNEMGAVGKPWFSVPYKLITTNFGSSGEIDAVVDSLLIDVATGHPSFCPQFRLVKEISNQVVKIWNKGDTHGCQTPYAAPSPSNST
ncbi:MAG: serine/threonine-protein kinase [Actinomycetes bacterium]